MNKIFCSQCGQKHEYADSKPKFCSECGSPLGAISTAKQKKVEYEDDDEDEDINFDVSKISLRVESHQEKGVKFGDIIREASPPGEKTRRATLITPEELVKRSTEGYRFSID